MKYRWVGIVVAVIAGALAGGADLDAVMLAFLLFVAGVLALMAKGGETVFRWAFDARLERRLSSSAHPERITRGLVALAVVMVAAFALTLAGGPSWIRLAAYGLVAIVVAISVWSAGRSTG